MIGQTLRRYQILLIVTAILCGARVLVLAHVYTRDALQVDFAAMYYAGATMHAGLDPYRNHVETRPELWDGVAPFRHSRYLYPPIVAYALEPVSMLSYPVAKRVWAAASLVVLAAGVVLVIRAAGVEMDRTRWLLVVIAASWMFPLRALIERGQIDSFTLLFIAGGFWLIFARRRDYVGGAVIALAGFIKLQCFYLWPMLLVARRPRAAIGMAAGAVVILLLQIATCGWPLTRQYVTQELSRISRGGEVGAEADRVDPAVLARVAGDLPSGDVLAGGRWRYRYTLLPDYAQMASLVPYARGAVRAVTHIRLPTPPVSIPLLAAALAWMAITLRRRVADDSGARLAFVLACLIVVLLVAPITWTTNLVWLAPLVVLVMTHRTALAVIGLALLILPDAMALGFRPASPWLGAILGAQYLIALLCLLPYTLRTARGRVAPS